MKHHGPYCIEPDEVGARGMCCCDGTEESAAAEWAEYRRKRGLVNPAPNARYDDVYTEGVKWLDSQ